MTIEVKQTCDGCGNERFIEMKRRDYSSQTVHDKGASGGWKDVSNADNEDNHLCPKCIKKALKRE